MSINTRFFQIETWSDDGDDYLGSGCWFRIFGFGLHFTNGRVSFSERYGYEKFFKIPFTKYRFNILKRKND